MSGSTTSNKLTILQDITINKSLSVENNIESCYRTASSFIFEEEPIFSDSDQENEYYKTISFRNKCLKQSNETSKFNEIHLSPSELKILEVIDKCPNITTDVNNDFKEFIDLCKWLQFKYKHHVKPSDIENFNTTKISNGSVTTQNTKSISTTEMHSSQEKFMPSKCGSSKNGNFDSQICINKDRSMCFEKEETNNKVVPEKQIALLNSRKKVSGRRKVPITNNSAKAEMTLTNLHQIQKTQMKTRSAKSLPANATLEKRESVSSRLTSTAKQGQYKSRSLYSPQKWLHSHDFINLCKTEVTFR